MYGKYQQGMQPGPMQRNCPTGWVEATHYNPFIFDQQFHSFHTRGYAVDPTAALKGESNQVNYVGTALEPAAEGGPNLLASSKKRKKKGDPADDTFRGPWAPFKDKPPLQLVCIALYFVLRCVLFLFSIVICFNRRSTLFSSLSLFALHN